jgi:uncharacterized protein
LLLRLIVILFIGYVVLSALKSLIRSGPAKPSGQPQSNDSGEEMVFDPQCRSYVPKSDAIEKSGQYFCSQECARIYLSR